MDRKRTVATPQVCFCDTELLAAGQTCSDAEDYSVELGKVRGERPSQFNGAPIMKNTI